MFWRTCKYFLLPKKDDQSSISKRKFKSYILTSYTRSSFSSGFGFFNWFILNTLILECFVIMRPRLISTFYQYLEFRFLFWNRTQCLVRKKRKEGREILYMFISVFLRKIKSIYNNSRYNNTKYLSCNINIYNASSI